jgi:hypothetical protein
MRLLPASTTNRSPTGSSATPTGPHSVDAAGCVWSPKLQPPVPVSSAWPNTRSALVSPLPETPVVVSGVLYSSTRLSEPSAMYTLPVVSNAICCGLQRVPAFTALHPLVVKLPPWPKTLLAVMFDGGVPVSLYSSTRSLLPSAI